MAKGRSHDPRTWLLALPFTLAVGAGAGLAGMGHGRAQLPGGGLLLSPRFSDTRSNATRRWGPLRCSGGPPQGVLSPPLSALPQAAAGARWTPGPTGRFAGPGPGSAAVFFRGAAAPGAAGLAGAWWREQRPAGAVCAVRVEGQQLAAP